MILSSVVETLTMGITWLRVALETVGAFWIGIGFLYAVVALIRAHLLRQTASFTHIRLTFSRYLSLTLEFQLAADILSTAVAPSWQELGKLGATAVIRTALNYFLSREIREYRSAGKDELAVTPASPSPSAEPA